MKYESFSVAEYEMKFNQLSHYTAYMITTEQAKRIKFEEGLQFKVKNEIMVQDITTMSYSLIG